MWRTILFTCKQIHISVLPEHKGTYEKGVKMKYKERLAQVTAYYQQGLKRVRTTTQPKGQKFPNGARVRIADNLGPYMSHFPAGRGATVKYTYAHAYGGTDVKSYCLDVDGHGEISWYHEHQLKLEV